MWSTAELVYVGQARKVGTWANISKKSLGKHCNYSGLKGARLHAWCFVNDLFLACFSMPRAWEMIWWHEMAWSHVIHGQSHDTWANFSKKSFRNHCNYNGSVVIQWWFKDDSMMIQRLFNDDSMMTQWWFNDDSAVVGWTIVWIILLATISYY